MLNRRYNGQVCSVARTLEVLGERWTLLIVRDVMLGLHRFDDFRLSLEIARNVLTDRLQRLVEAGVLERIEYQQRPPRFEYHLSAVGLELAVPVVGLMRWGDRHLPEPAGPPRLTRHKACGGHVEAALRCEVCGTSLAGWDLELPPGPGLSETPRHGRSDCA